MDEFASFHVSPIIVRPVARVGIIRATAVRFATDRHVFQNSAGTKVIHGVECVANAGDPRNIIACIRSAFGKKLKLRVLGPRCRYSLKEAVPQSPLRQSA